MALDFCFDRKTFLEQICRACSRYYSYDDNDVEKMEFFRIFDDVKSEQPSYPLVTIADAIKNEDGTAETIGKVVLPSEEVKEIFQEMVIWNLNIKPYDGLPQQVCKDCMERFRNVKNFREECLDTQKVLESYFKDMNQLVNRSPKSEDSIKIEPGASPTASFNTDDLVEEVPESPVGNERSPMSSPQLRQSPKIADLPYYADSSIGTPPPLFEEIKTEPIDVQTMDFIKTEEELKLGYNQKDDLETDNYVDEINVKAFSQATLPSQTYISDDEDSSSTSNEETELLDSNTEQRSNQLQCKICLHTFPTRFLLKEHLTNLHPEKKSYACNICSSTFKSKFTLTQHKLKHNRLDTTRCEKCGKFFRSQLHLQRHTKNFHLTSTYTCHICHQKFEQYTQIRFQYHVRQHGEKRFHCQYCDKSFHQKIHLINHERTHTKEQPFQCDICGKSFRQQTACHEHVLTHSDPKPFKCKVCKKGFTQRSSLRLHCRLHAGNRPFHCEFCGQNFTQKVQLEMHEMTHGNGNAYAKYHCEICNKKFHVLHQLTTHIEMIHKTIDLAGNANGRCICHHCNATFTNQTHLQSHIEDVHFHKRLQSCIYCGQTFTLAAHLKSHMQTHNKTNVYETLKCQYCDKICKDEHALELHEEQHEQCEQFKCSFCEQTFLYRSVMREHMLMHLGEKTKTKCGESAAFSIDKGIL